MSEETDGLVRGSTFALPWFMNLGRSGTLVSLSVGVVGLLVLAGCDIPPRGPVDLRDSQIVGVHLSEESGLTSVCPGTDIPLLVDVDAKVPGESGTVRLHSRREHIDDWIFDPTALHMSSREGTVDENAIFHASADPAVSAAEGFLVNVHTPGSASFGMRFVPSYDCVTTFGKQGSHGLPGDDGETAFVRNDREGLVGEQGTTGGVGGPGPTLTMYVTWVRTVFAKKVIGIVSDGDVRGMSLASADGSIVLLARGGDGGQGGRGGDGSSGGDNGPDQATCKRGRHGGCISTTFAPPGYGGTGGTGGEGGPGGQLVVHVDARYPEIEDHLVLDARGGKGGDGGFGGSGGQPLVSYNYSNEPTGARSHGSPGSAGASGKMGPSGIAKFVLDDVREHFAGNPAIQPI